MSKFIKADITVIGAGIIGCAIARELSIKYKNKKIIVLEKLSAPGLETSSKNSGVLHSGIHQNPSFLKSKLAARGSKEVAAYVESKGLPIIDSGMIVVIGARSIFEGLYKEISSLWNLVKNAKKAKIKIKFLTFFGVKRLSPNIRAFGGIFIRDVWIVDPLSLTESFYKDAKSNGVDFLYNNPVQKIELSQEHYNISTPNYIINTGLVINSAGLYADEIARMAGFGDYKIYPWRGEYYQVSSSKSDLVRRLVYPVMHRGSVSKGMHFSPRPDGSLYIGPNARPVNKKNDYTNDKTTVDIFFNHARKYLPKLEKNDLTWAYSGIRPKTSPTAEETDFIINLDHKNPIFVNLIGIESPGIASCMAIAKYVYNLIEESIN